MSSNNQNQNQNQILNENHNNLSLKQRQQIINYVTTTKNSESINPLCSLYASISINKTGLRS
jgi:hypothetical protein